MTKALEYPSSPPDDPFIKVSRAVQIVKAANVIELSDQSIRRHLDMAIDEGVITSKTIGKKLLLVKLSSLKKWIKELAEETA